MAERLLKLSGCDQVLAQEQRYFTDLGLTALNLGQASLWSEPAWQKRKQGLTDPGMAVAAGPRPCFSGQQPGPTRQQLPPPLRAAGSGQANADDLPPQQRSLIHGALERMLLSIERLAGQTNPSAPWHH